MIVLNKKTKFKRNNVKTVCKRTETNFIRIYNLGNRARLN